MFEKIDIGIKTFLRDEKLFHAIQGIQKNYPGARMIIVDDGDQTEEKDGIYADLTRQGHIVDILPFDSGFGKKSNKIVELSTRPYILIGSDDFEFDEEAAKGLSELQKVLDLDESVDIASGRVNKRPYEFDLEIVENERGITIREHVAEGWPKEYFPMETKSYFQCDLTVNYSLIRESALYRVAWDDDVKIGGGEHGAFFYDCRMAGLRTVLVEGVNINEQKGRDSQHYRKYRDRANSPERPCFDKREIIEYVLGDGRIDYRKQND